MAGAGTLLPAQAQSLDHARKPTASRFRLFTLPNESDCKTGDAWLGGGLARGARLKAGWPDPAAAAE